MRYMNVKQNKLLQSIKKEGL